MESSDDEAVFFDINDLESNSSSNEEITDSNENHGENQEKKPWEKDGSDSKRMKSQKKPWELDSEDEDHHIPNKKDKTERKPWESGSDEQSSLENDPRVDDESEQISKQKSKSPFDRKPWDENSEEEDLFSRDGIKAKIEKKPWEKDEDSDQDTQNQNLKEVSQGDTGMHLRKPWEIDTDEEESSKNEDLGNLSALNRKPWEIDSNDDESLNKLDIKKIPQDTKPPSVGRKPWEIEEASSDSENDDTRNENERNSWEYESDEGTLAKHIEVLEDPSEKMEEIIFKKRSGTNLDSTSLNEGQDLNRDSISNAQENIASTRIQHDSKQRYINEIDLSSSGKESLNVDTQKENNLLMTEKSDTFQESIVSEQIFDIDALESIDTSTLTTNALPEEKNVDKKDERLPWESKENDISNSKTGVAVSLDIPGIDINTSIASNGSKDTSKPTAVGDSWENMEFGIDLQDILEDENFDLELKLEDYNSSQKSENIQNEIPSQDIAIKLIPKDSNIVEYEYHRIGMENMVREHKDMYEAISKNTVIQPTHPRANNHEFLTVSNMLSRKHREAELILSNDLILTLVLNMYINQQFDMEDQIKDLKRLRNQQNFVDLLSSNRINNVYDVGMEYSTSNQQAKVQQQYKADKQTDRLATSVFIERQYPTLMRKNQAKAAPHKELTKETKGASEIVFNNNKIEKRIKSESENISHFSERGSLAITINEYIQKFCSKVDKNEQYLFKQSMNMYPEYKGLSVEDIKSVLVIEIIGILSRILEDSLYSKTQERISVKFEGPIFIRKYACELMIYLPFHPLSELEFALEHWVQDFHLLEIISTLTLYIQKHFLGYENGNADSKLFALHGISNEHKRLSSQKMIQFRTAEDEIRKLDPLQFVTQTRHSELMNSIQNSILSKEAPSTLRIQKELEFVIDKLLSDKEIIELIVAQVRKRLK